jgi:hypothetical protein
MEQCLVRSRKGAPPSAVHLAPWRAFRERPWFGAPVSFLVPHFSAFTSPPQILQENNWPFMAPAVALLGRRKRHGRGFATKKTFNP